MNHLGNNVAKNIKRRGLVIYRKMGSSFEHTENFNNLFFNKLADNT